MKKKTPIAFALSVVALVLAACGGGGGADADDQATAPTVSDAAATNLATMGVTLISNDPAT